MPAGAELSGPRAFALLYSPPDQQPVVRQLLAIEAEILASLTADHSVAHARLSWWRDECARTARGNPVHPLTRALAAAFAGRALPPPQGLAGLVDVAVWDLAAATFERRAELTAYCARWSTAVIAPCARFAGGAAPENAAVESLGSQLRELELLLALAEDARAGRLRLPLDELAGARLPVAQAAQVLAQPPWPAALLPGLRLRHQQLRQQLRATAAQFTAPQRAALRGVLVWATLVCRASRLAQGRLPAAAAARDHHAPLDGLSAWRAARRAAHGKNPL